MGWDEFECVAGDKDDKKLKLIENIQNFFFILLPPLFTVWRKVEELVVTHCEIRVQHKVNYQ